MTTESQRITELEEQVNVLSSEIIKLGTNITQLARKLSEEKQRVSGLEFYLNKKLQAIESSLESNKIYKLKTKKGHSSVVCGEDTAAFTKQNAKNIEGVILNRQV